MDRYFSEKKAGTKKREKSLEISRFLAVWLAKRLFSSCGSILTTQHGRGRRIRTRDPRFWRPVLYQLSYTPVQRWYYSTYPKKKQGVSRKIRKTFFDFSPYGTCADATDGNFEKNLPLYAIPLRKAAGAAGDPPHAPRSRQGQRTPPNRYRSQFVNFYRTPCQSGGSVI